MPASLTPLRHRSFALALAANFISSVGGFMQTVALGVYLTETTHDPLWLGLITLALWLPSLVASPLAGVAADRRDRRRFIQINNLVMAASTSVLAGVALAHRLHPWVACVLAVVEGSASAAAWPAYQSLVPDLVDGDEVLAAVSLSSAQFNLGRVIGPLVAGLVLSIASPAWCFVANAVSFLVVVVAFAFVRLEHVPRPRDTSSWFARMGAGASQAWRIRGCRYPILTVMAVAFTVGPFISLVPEMAIDVLHAGRLGTAWLVTAQGLGAVLAALTLPSLARRTSRSFVLGLAMGAIVLAEALYGLAPSLLGAAGAIMLLGGAYIGVMTGLNTSVQLHAPARERTRILSLYTMSLSIAYPLGSFLQAALAREFGLRAVTVLAAGTGMLGVAALALWVPRYWRTFSSGPEVSAVALAD